MKPKCARTSLYGEAMIKQSKAIAKGNQVLDGCDRQLADLLRTGHTMLTLDGGRNITAELTEESGDSCLLFKSCNGRVFEAKFRPRLGQSQTEDPWTCKAYKSFLALSPAECDEFKNVIRILACAYMDYWAATMRQN
jgi:hypothetical protein